MDERLRRIARESIGFMPDDEGIALYRAGLEAGRAGPLLEIGTYCGKSSVYLGAAAREAGTLLFTVDHHRGSEEHQPGWEYRDERLVDAGTGRYNTLPAFQRTIERAGLEDVVVGIVGDSSSVARYWGARLGLLFIDGSHTDASAAADYEGWTPHLAPGGLLAIHDVYLDPAEGGQAPHHIYRRALETQFDEAGSTGTLRILRKR